MKNIPSLLLTAAAALAAAMPAQEPESQPLPKAESKAEAKPPAKKKDVQALIQALGSDSYRERLEAERALKAAGKDALPALEQAAEHADDVEVQWRARRLLRKLQRADGGGLVQRDRAPAQEPQEPQEPQQPGRAVQPFRRWRGGDPGADAMREQFDSLFEQFERDFGIDIPRARFFGDGFFKDLQEQMGKANVHSQGMTMQIGPDGAVKVEVKEKGEDGKVETKTYEAPDLGTFQKNHPGVLHQNGLGMGLFPGGGWRGSTPLRGFTFDWNGAPLFRTAPHGADQQPRAGDEPEVDVPAEAPAPAPVGKRLGISIEPEIAAGVREYLQLAEGVGLMVREVTPDSLGAALGLQPGDIVTRIGEHGIGSPQDVQQALAPIKKGETVEVQFVRKGAEKTAKAAKTEDVASDGGSGQPAKGKLEPRRIR
ncbi:MAG: PDZ domain-containing protein [Planctomycetota bacterium]